MTEIIVLGAGMIGVSTALELQSRGHSVILVDRRPAGRETSFGNAGFIQAEVSEPYALPRDPMTLLRFGLGLRNDVTYSLSGLAQMAPALWSYFRFSAPERHRAISAVYAQLTRMAVSSHMPLIHSAGAGNLISTQGYYELYRNQRSFDAAHRNTLRLMETYNVEADFLDGADLRKREPAIKKKVAGAVHWGATWLCSDPGALTKAYADLFVARGGEFVQGYATTLTPVNQTPGSTSWTVQTGAGPINAAHVVVALGPWSADVMAQFGYRVRMVYKRGYHAHFAAPKTLNSAIMDADNAVVLAPMKDGLRIATGAALVDRNSPAETSQITRGAAGVSDIIDLGERVDEPQWVGTRPCMPDMLPVVGAAPRHRGLWCHFGHGHQGFTLGPATARLLANAMEGTQSPLLKAVGVPRAGVFY